MNLKLAVGICAAILAAVILIGSPQVVIWAGRGKWIAQTRAMKISADMISIIHAAEHFKATRGKYPITLDELSQMPEEKAGPASLQAVRDPWNHEYLNFIRNGKPVAACHGRDGVPGGTDEDQDYEWSAPQGAGLR